MFEKMWNYVEKFLKKGLFHLMGITIVNKWIAFFTNIILVRILTKNEYGIFTSAFNIYSIFMLFSGMGILGGILYFCSDKQEVEKRKAYYFFSFRYGMMIETVIAFFIVMYAIKGGIGIDESRKYVLSLALLPFASFLFRYFAMVLRTRKENIKYARLLNINSVSYSSFAIIGSYKWGIIGMILGYYFSYLITALVGWKYCEPYLGFRGSFLNLSRVEKKEIVVYSFYSGMTTAMNGIFHLIDIAILGVVTGSTSILASYKIATILPEKMIFIPESIMLVSLPYFIERSEDIRWISKNTKKLYLILALVCGTILFACMVGASFIILLFWGAEYLDAVHCFKILSISFFIQSVFRITSTNLLAAMGRVKFNMVTGIVSGILNIVLDVTLIQNRGSIGASWATLLSTIWVSIISFTYLIKWLHLNKGRYDQASSIFGTGKNKS